MGTLYLDGVPSWTAGGPINFANYLPTNIRGLVRALFKGEVRAIPVATDGRWTNTGVNGGSVSSESSFNKVCRATAATGPNSTIISRNPCFGLNSNGALMTGVDWDKDLLLACSIARNTSNATALSYVQLKEASTIGVLGEAGIQLSVENLALKGNAFGTGLGTEVNLSQSLTNTYPALVAMFLNASGVEWFFNNVSKGTLTAAGKFPTGMGATEVNLCFSHDNGGTATQSDFYSGIIWIVQEV